MSPSRASVLAALRQVLAAALDELGHATAMARDEATNAESRPENKYDTRAIEASYLAAGQGERLASLRRLSAWAEVLDPEPAAAVELGALVEIAQDGRASWVLVAPEGGLRLEVDGVEIALVSVRSPLGQALRGLGPGDGDEVEAPVGRVEVEVVEVS